MAPTSTQKTHSIGAQRLIAAVVASRLLIAAMGALGETQWRRWPGWLNFDAARMTQHFGSVGNALAASAVRWDSIHYINIARHGYQTRANTVFFPLYPLLISLVKLPLRSAALAGVVISAVSFAVALVLLHRLVSRELNVRAADAAVLLLACAPLSFFFTAVYTESLFLALTLGVFELATRGKWFCACAVAALATVTRVPGILLLAPLAVIWWRQGHRRDLRTLAPLALPPLALAAFLAYLHSDGFSWLAPLRNQKEVHQHSFVAPISTLLDAVRDGIKGFQHALSGDQLLSSTSGSPIIHGTLNAVLLIVLINTVLTLILAFRRLPLEYGVYSTLIVLVCLCSPSAGIPLRSLDRYMLVAFPLWAVAGDWLARRRLLWPVLVISLLALCFYTIQFARWTMVA